MGEDDRLIQLTERLAELSALVSTTAAQVERLEGRLSATEGRVDDVRPLVETIARSETEATFRGLIMSWSSLSEKFGELYSDVHGTHGIERRLEEARICLLGREGTNGIRGTVRLYRYAFIGVALVLALVLGDKLGFYTLRALIPGP